MSSIIYGVIEETYDIGGKKRVSYGAVVCENGGADGTAAVIERINDVSSNKESIEALVEKCNRLELSAIHFKDVVSDFILSENEEK